MNTTKGLHKARDENEINVQKGMACKEVCSECRMGVGEIWGMWVFKGYWIQEEALICKDVISV